MIGYIKGKILNLTDETALICTASGLGFELSITASAYDLLNGKSEGELFTYMHVKEDGVALYGFASAEEKEMFLKLITVSGVGPKMGIGVLSRMKVAEIATAIAMNDVKRLSAVKGLGKKTAERIILELREKVSLSMSMEKAEESLPAVDGEEDAIVALMTLGFTRAESIKAIARARAQGASTVEDIIMLALRGMSK